MKNLACSILFFLLLPSYSTAKSIGDYQNPIYVRNYSGDSLTFNLTNLQPIIREKISVRVNGIATPEIKGKCEKGKYDAQ